MSKTLEVPKWELENGIRQCLTVAALRLSEAEDLLARDWPTQATIAFTFGVEEFGKAVLLRRALEGARDLDALVSVEGFYDHRAKLKAAATEIPKESLRLGRGTAEDWNARLDAMFVDWVPDAPDGLTGQWKWGAGTDPGVLADSIKGTLSRLANASAEWA